MELYFCPCSNSVAYSHFLDTIRNVKITQDELNGVVQQEVIDEIITNVGTEYRLWGLTSDPSDLRNFQQLQVGDILVFYHNGRLLGKCSLKYKMDNSDIAVHHWQTLEDGGTWNNLLFVDDFVELYVESTKLDESRLFRQGFSKMNGADKDRIIIFLLKHLLWLQHQLKL